MKTPRAFVYVGFLYWYLNRLEIKKYLLIHLKIGNPLQLAGNNIFTKQTFYFLKQRKTSEKNGTGLHFLHLSLMSSLMEDS